MRRAGAPRALGVHGARAALVLLLAATAQCAEPPPPPTRVQEHTLGGMLLGASALSKAGVGMIVYQALFARAVVRATPAVSETASAPVKLDAANFRFTI